MVSALALELLAVSGCAVLALVVGLRRERSLVASGVLALLFSLVLWIGGLAWADAAELASSRITALRASVLGNFAAVGFWLLVAVRHRWPRRTRGATTMLVAMAPVVVFFVGAVTSAGHGWFVLPDAERDPSLMGWAGPATYALAAVSLGYGLAGTGIFAMAGVRLVRRGEVRPGIALLLTLFGTPLLTLEAASGGPALTLPVAAASLTLSVLVLALTALRYQLLEPPPLGHREVIDHLRHGVLIANAAGEILDHNSAAERLLGFAPRGGALCDAVASVAMPAGRESTRRALADIGEVGRPVTLQLDAIGGRLFEVSARPIAGDQGEWLGQIATLRDRTEERRFADAALRAQKLETIGTLAAGIAHEVNNPLAFVRADLGEILRMGELVEQRLAEGHSELALRLRETGELAREAQSGLERIHRAVSDVRRLAAAPHGAEEEVSIDAVVRDAVALAQRRAGDSLRIGTRLAPDLPRVTGSEQLLVQAVLSLLLDALHALEGTPEPRLEVETGADDEGIFVRVRDNGPGVPEPLRDRTFEGAIAGAPDASRVGLGLSVAAGIAHDHGGSLRTESAASGGAYLLRLAASEVG